jgi:CRP-like cAMP-binding protein
MRTRPDGQIAAQLACTAVLRLCSAGELFELAATAKPKHFEPGDALCVEGAAARECYAITEGEAVVRIDGRIVRNVGAGEVVGERGPLEGRRRSATVTAVTSMSTWPLSSGRLLAVLARNPALAERMREEIARRYPP